MGKRVPLKETYLLKSSRLMAAMTAFAFPIMPLAYVMSILLPDWVSTSLMKAQLFAH